MCKGYVLGWLDTLISVTLNPDKTDIAAAMPEDAAKIQDQVTVQKNMVLSAIKCTVFNLNDESKVKCLIQKYHSSLISLLDQAIEDRAGIPGKSPLKKILNKIILCLDEVLSVIEIRFKSYLSIDERVPSTYLAIVKKELMKKMPVISDKLTEYQSFITTFSTVKHELQIFFDIPSDRQKCSFRKLFYIKGLFRELESLEPVDENSIYTSLDEVLISMNFNSTDYIQDLTQRIAAYINGLEQTTERLERALFYLKLFKQLHRRPNIVFNSKDAGLYTQVENWFSQEIFYLEKQIHYSIIPLKKEVKKKVTKHKERQKVLSMLSVDQMALILRAADDLRIIMARSLSSVFKSIAPHLSTQYQEDISYDSMRSKSYSAESRDKEIAIETLQQIIKKIKEY